MYPRVSISKAKRSDTRWLFVNSSIIFIICIICNICGIILLGCIRNRWTTIGVVATISACVVGWSVYRLGNRYNIYKHATPLAIAISLEF